VFTPLVTKHIAIVYVFTSFADEGIRLSWISSSLVIKTVILIIKLLIRTGLQP